MTKEDLYYIFKCEKHNYSSKEYAGDDYVSCPHCDRENIDKGLVECSNCRKWFKPNKRYYLLNDPDCKLFRYKKPEGRVLKNGGRACSIKCVGDYWDNQFDTGEYSGR